MTDTTAPVETTVFAEIAAPDTADEFSVTEWIDNQSRATEDDEAETDHPADEDELAEDETTGEGTGRPTEKAAKSGKRTRPGSLAPCLCSKYSARLGVGEPTTTGCTRMTNRMFAQGHDAKLVSFLVGSWMADKDLYITEPGGQPQQLDGPASAASAISPALGDKARGALTKAHDKAEARELRAIARAAKAEQRAADKLARDAAKAERAEAAAARKAEFAKRQAAKTSTPREIAANVVEGSVVGDPLPGDIATSELDPTNPDHRDQWARDSRQVKVGRWTYTGIPQADGSLRYLNTAGEMKTAPAGRWTSV